MLATHTAEGKRHKIAENRCADLLGYIWGATPMEYGDETSIADRMYFIDGQLDCLVEIKNRSDSLRDVVHLGEYIRDGRQGLIAERKKILGVHFLAEQLGCAFRYAALMGEGVATWTLWTPETEWSIEPEDFVSGRAKATCNSEDQDVQIDLIYLPIGGATWHPKADLIAAEKEATDGK